jgi:hypothetical protein
MYLLSVACGTYVIILDVIIISEQKVVIFIYWGYSVSSDVPLLKKNYIPLLIYNFDELVMLRGNRKKFTYAFCKSGALHNITNINEFARNHWCSKVEVELDAPKSVRSKKKIKKK